MPEIHKVRLGILSGTDLANLQRDALPSAITKKQRLANQSRSADSALAAINKASDRKSAAAIVKKSEFTELKNQVNANEKVLGIMARGQGLIQGASGLTTASGIFGAGLGFASGAIPGISIAVFAAKLAYDKFVAQFERGGARDTRKKVLAEDVSDIGIDTETDILSGRKLFLSNPLNNQGLPRGNSNTENIRDGTRIYNLRQEGSYL